VTSTVSGILISPFSTYCLCGSTAHQPELKMSWLWRKEVTSTPTVGISQMMQIRIRMPFTSALFSRF